MHIYWWWDFKVLLRRLLLLVVFVTQFTNVKNRTYGVAITCLIIFAIHLACFPYKDALDNWLEALSLLILTYAAITSDSSSGAGE